MAWALHVLADSRGNHRIARLLHFRVEPQHKRYGVSGISTLFTKYNAR